jgi:signal transduction histidine kinase
MMIEQRIATPIPHAEPPALDVDLATAAQQTPVGLLIVDHRCRILQHNPAAAALGGAIVNGQRFCEVFRAHACMEAGGATCLLAYALQGVERRANPRWVTLEPQNTPCSVLLKATSIPEGVAVTIIPSMLVDEADRRRREMIAAAVHDLRHPITIQSLAVELLTTHAHVSNEIRPLLEKLRRATASLTTNVDDLLNRMLFDLNMLTIHPQSLLLLPLLESIAWQIQPMLDRRRQSVTLDVPDTLEVYADPAALEHMVVNLVLNAHKYAADQDRIVVTARARTQRNVTEILVRDHGPGIPPQERRRVFERFYRGDGARGQRGAGLGLAIVRSLAVLHGGEVGVRAGRGGGALFWIRLPNPPPAERPEG